MKLVKPSQHGLGHLLNPADPDNENRDWITDSWQWVLTDALNLPNAKPTWFDRPAVGSLSVSNPHLHQLLRHVNHGRAYGDQIKQFNFLLIAFVSMHERPADDQHMVLIAPYDTDPRAWPQQPWINRNSTRTYTITTEPSHGYERSSVVSVKTYRHTLREYATHPEAKSADPNGRPCTRQTRGLLSRRPIEVRTITHIGKEANNLEDIQAGLHARQNDALTAYDDTEQLRFEAALPRLREVGIREVARRTGHSISAVHAVLIGRSKPRRDARERYIQATMLKRG